MPRLFGYKHVCRWKPIHSAAVQSDRFPCWQRLISPKRHYFEGWLHCCLNMILNYNKWALHLFIKDVSLHWSCQSLFGTQISLLNLYLCPSSLCEALCDKPSAQSIFQNVCDFTRMDAELQERGDFQLAARLWWCAVSHLDLLLSGFNSHLFSVPSISIIMLSSCSCSTTLMPCRQKQNHKWWYSHIVYSHMCYIHLVAVNVKDMRSFFHKAPLFRFL